MDGVRRLWFAVALLAVVGTVAVLLGILFGSAGLSVDAVSVSTEPPTNGTASCDGVVVRSVRASVSLSRSALGPENPQWWPVGLTVRASVFRSAKHRQLTLPAGSSETVTVPFTDVIRAERAPQEQVSVVIQVLRGNEEIARETVTATLAPVTLARNC